MGSNPRRSSLRDLRLASAASILSTSSGYGRPGGLNSRTSRTHGVTRAAGGVAYLSAPKQTLSLADVKSRDHAGQKVAGRHLGSRETRRVRKKREWLARLERYKNSSYSKPDDSSDQSKWAYLPDLVLEEIFKMLPFEVRYPYGI